MDGGVVDIHSRRPHCTGRVKCLSCKHEWEAVAPTGAIDMECPECGCFRGVWIFPLMCVEDVFQCDCGSDVFFIVRGGFKRCLGCGLKSELRECYE